MDLLKQPDCVPSASRRPQSSADGPPRMMNRLAFPAAATPVRKAPSEEPPSPPSEVPPDVPEPPETPSPEVPDIAPDEWPAETPSEIPMEEDSGWQASSP
jgi:hypothetical protein